MVGTSAAVIPAALSARQKTALMSPTMEFKIISGLLSAIALHSLPNFKPGNVDVLLAHDLPAQSVDFIVGEWRLLRANRPNPSL